MSERIDQLDKHYLPIEKINTFIWVLFLMSAILSIAILYTNSIQYPVIKQAIEVSFVVIVILYSILSMYNSYYLIPSAEKLRRMQLLSDSFGVPLTSENTENYYNNEFLPSLNRLGMNVLENSFFAKNVCLKMAEKGRIKILTYFLFWIVAMTYRNTDLSLIIIITQVLFSGEIIINFIKLEMLRFQNNSIYDKLYTYFLHDISSTTPQGIATILDLFTSYEVAKANASLKQSSKIFMELNPKLTEEWDSIRNTLVNQRPD
jgi:hypothetical protein